MSEQAAQSTAVAEIKNKPMTVGELLFSKKKQLEMALPKHMSVDRLLRICMTEITKNPKLGECTAPSLIGAILQAAQIGLEPGSHLGHCYLVPFRNNKKGVMEVQFIAGYRGLIDLARRSGKITVLVARAVYARDQFDYEYGLEERLIHVPAAGKRGEFIGVYAVARFTDGQKQFEYMPREDVELIRKESKSANDGPWVTDYDEMAKKTVMRRLCKYLPASPELQAATTLDEYAEKGVAQDNSAILAHIGIMEPEALNPGQPAGVSKVQAAIAQSTPAKSSKPIQPKEALPAESKQVDQGSFASFQETGALPPQKPARPREDVIRDVVTESRALGISLEALEKDCLETVGKTSQDLSDIELEAYLEKLRNRRIVK
jgi:recombination protein RecT